jgi:UDP-sugar transporter A1/2/3
MSLQPILMTQSKNPTGGFDYSVPLSTMFSELLKLSLSMVLLIHSRATQPSSRALLDESAGKEFLAFMVPALIYFVNNNCLFYILQAACAHDEPAHARARPGCTLPAAPPCAPSTRHGPHPTPPRAPQAVDPTTFQLLSQMKTIFTGLLFRVFLGRHLSGAQYLALVTLACGTATSQIPSAAHPLGHASAHGLILSLVSCMLSAFGGIYSEKLLKKRPSASIHWQNMQLYAWGVLFNALGFAIKDGGSLANGWSTGYENSWAWAVVLCNACNGLAISAVLKFADNIARVYAHAIAMVATMLVSVRLFAAPITPQLVIAIALVGTSTLQYNLPKPALLGEWDAVDAKEEESKQLMGSPAMVRANEEEAADQHAGRPMLRLDGKR